MSWHLFHHRQQISESSRRDFLRLAAAGVLGWSHRVGAQSQSPTKLLPYIADVDGNDFLNEVDPQIVSAAQFSRRGFDLIPNDGWDFRADVFGRGAVDPDATDAVSQTINVVGNGPVGIRRRPITVCWHYGWHETLSRPPALQTVRFLGGDYLSSDSEVEGTFNSLKNECGISVDALSWMPSRVRPPLEASYRAGYLRAFNSATRLTALLYESFLALGNGGTRIDMGSSQVRARLADDFEQMGHFFTEIRDQYSTRPFLIADRPVIFIFASHSWGSESEHSTDAAAMTEAIDVARTRFEQVYGTTPYLVGEELWTLSHPGYFPDVRAHRVSHFDAVFSYHNALLKPGTVEVPLDSFYSAAQLRASGQGNRRLTSLRNRYTGAQILAIPSVAAGFAKPGFPTITVNRSQYTDFMRLQMEYHWQEYLRIFWRHQFNTRALPAAIFTVGSWNEEFEGHAVFPASFNLSVRSIQQGGFDLLMAIKEVFGWNHYAHRDP